MWKLNCSLKNKSFRHSSGSTCLLSCSNACPPPQKNIANSAEHSCIASCMEWVRVACTFLQGVRTTVTIPPCYICPWPPLLPFKLLSILVICGNIQCALKESTLAGHDQSYSGADWENGWNPKLCFIISLSIFQSPSLRILTDLFFWSVSWIPPTSIENVKKFQRLYSSHS